MAIAINLPGGTGGFGKTNISAGPTSFATGTEGWALNLNKVLINQLASSPAARVLAQKAGDQVAEVAAKIAPRRSGSLAESIHAETDQDVDGYYADVSWDKQHFYGLFQELPTRTHPNPHPFLVPALEQTRI